MKKKIRGRPKNNINSSKKKMTSQLRMQHRAQLQIEYND